MKKLSLVLTVSAFALASHAFAGEKCAAASSSCSGKPSACCKDAKAKQARANFNLKGAQLMAMR